MKQNNYGFINGFGNGQPRFGGSRGNGHGNPNSRGGGGYGNGAYQNSETGDGRSFSDNKHVLSSERQVQAAIEYVGLRV